MDIFMITNRVEYYIKGAFKGYLTWVYRLTNSELEAYLGGVFHALMDSPNQLIEPIFMVLKHIQGVTNINFSDLKGYSS